MEIKEFIATLKKSNFSLAIEKEKLILKGDKRKVAKDQIQAIKSNQYIIDYIKEHKNELIEYLSLFSEKVSFENKSSNISSIYQLSGLQEGMLFHGLYDGGSAGYSEQFVCDLIGPDLAIFSQSWKHLLRRHSILRSAFFHDQFNMPVQCVYREVELPVELLDLQNMGDKEQAAAIKSYEEADIQKGFDFKVAPLMRLGLLRLTEDRYRMIWTSHHILFDGWSLQILMEEFLNTHDSLTHGKTVSEGVEDRYEEYIRYIELIDKEQEKSYWLNYLKGVNQATLLPFIEITKERTKGIGTYQSVFLPVDTRTTQKIESYVQRHRITVNTLMQGVWSFLLHHYTGSSDIVYGVIVSGRPDDLPVIEQRVGMYINTLPLHSGMKEHDVIVTWLHGIQNEQVASRQFQHTPLHEVQGWIGVQGDLFDTILVFENYPLSKVLSSRKWSLQIENVQIRDQTNYPLTILINHAEQIIIRFSYNANLLAEVQVKKISEHFEHVLLQIIENVDGRVSNIKLLTPAEEHQLVVEFNANESLYPKHRGITDLFEEQVSKTPAGTAVVFEGERLSYLQLDERSNQLAHYLRSRGVKEETLVPICIERSLEMIIGILGILKAGGAYVPIDAGYPEERISYMLKDIGCKLVVTTSDYVGVFEKENAEVVCMDRLGDVLRAFSRDKAVNATGPDSLAYVMYTSGSTGKPKGVMVEHRNVVSLVRGIDYVSLSKEDILLSTGSPSFDATTFEYWSMLLNGGQLILCTENKLLDSELLKEEIDSRGVTKMWFTSSWFNQLVETDISVFEGLGTILVGGEKLSEQHIKKLSQTYGDVEIINGYGPTENTTFSLTCKISGLQISGPIPIGRPLSNRRVYVLDEWQRLVPVGVAGELYLGGDGLGRGYLNRPELTAEKFIADPFNKEPGARLYKTGDLGRWLADGNIEYLGRIDDQVKIRGYRIEPGEIESVLMQSGLVSQAVVMAKEDKEGTRRLISYVVPNGVFNKEAMLSYSRSRLPEYMLPSLWVELESVPLTPNGKVDKKSLPEPAANEPLGDKYTAPQNELEVKLTQIWQELLHIPRIGIHDNFFELGGNSLLVMRLGSSIRRQLEMELAIKSLFAHPTIAELAAHLGNQSKELLLPVVDVLPRPERIPLSFSQERLWFIDRLAGSSVQYHVPAVLRLKGKLNREALEGALQTIVNRHEVLRTMIGEYEGRAFQNIKDLNRWQISIVDGSVYKEDPEGLQKNIRQIISKPFDLSKDYMLRADLIVVQEQDHVLVVTMHHIASDGWSISILVKEVKELYEAYKEDRPAQLRPLKIQYADYAIWQRKFLQGEVLERKLDYWKTKLEGVAPLQLQTDYSRDVIQSTRGAIATFNINKELTQLLRKLSQQENATLFMTLLAAFKVLLYRYTGQQDICVGTSIANRPGQEMEELLGFFVNMLALRSEVHSDDFFTAVLQQVKQTTLEAYEHQDIPFEKVVAVIKERDLGRSPLFQVLFVLLNTPEVPELRLGELSLFKEDYEHTTAQFDITFLLTETPVGLRATVEYCTDLYHEQTITRMMGHFQELLSAIVKQPDEKVGLLPMLTMAEEHQLVVEFNANESLYP
ncbi:MAG: amino acid adenylation domain-containing protein, partial [Chitinophagaceae bacterium]